MHKNTIKENGLNIYKGTKQTLKISSKSKREQIGWVNRLPMMALSYVLY
jgi:hypothetical protein